MSTIQIEKCSVVGGYLTPTCTLLVKLLACTVEDALEGMSVQAAQNDCLSVKLKHIVT